MQKMSSEFKFFFIATTTVSGIVTAAAVGLAATGSGSKLGALVAIGDLALSGLHLQQSVNMFSQMELKKGDRYY